MDSYLKLRGSILLSNFIQSVIKLESSATHETPECINNDNIQWCGDQ